MKLVFSKDDSIYKIVQTIKKIPNYKKSSIDIHPENRIFRHSRRWTYLKTIIEEHHLDITFTAYDKLSIKYRESAGLPFHKKLKKSGLSSLSVNTVLQKINSFHKVMFLKKNYMSVFVILAEFSVLITLLYVFWTLISPNATVLITPAYQLENVVYNFRYYPQEDFAAHQFQKYLSIPYYTGTINYDYDMSANVQNIRYEQESAQGTVVIKNTYPYTYSLLNKTRIITDEGVLFTFNKRVDVPGGSEERPGTARVRVTAEERFDTWELIGEVGNIPKGKIAYIKNLNDEDKKRVTVEAYSQFKWGKTIPIGTVIQDDIKNVEAEILATIEKNKNRYLKSQYNNPEHIILPDESLYQIKIDKFETTSELWEASSFVEGKVDASIDFPFVLYEDVVKWIEAFLTQRAENDIHLTSFDKNSLALYTITWVDPAGDDPGYYLIPTKLPAIKKYNIETDALWIISEIKDKIAGLDTAAASKIILSYKEIDAVKTKITPRWYSIIPETKSRISFKFSE